MFITIVLINSNQKINWLFVQIKMIHQKSLIAYDLNREKVILRIQCKVLFYSVHSPKRNLRIFFGEVTSWSALEKWSSWLRTSANRINLMEIEMLIKHPTSPLSENINPFLFLYPTFALAFIFDSTRNC